MKQISEEWKSKISAKEKDKYEKIAAVENMKYRREFSEMKRREFLARKEARLKKRAELEAAAQNGGNKTKKSRKKFDGRMLWKRLGIGKRAGNHINERVPFYVESNSYLNLPRSRKILTILETILYSAFMI